MAELQLENMTISSLDHMFTINYTRLMELKVAEEKDENAISVLNEEINLLTSIIKTKSEAENKTAD